MRLQRLTNYLISHRWQAIVLTFLISFIPVIGIFGIIYAAFVTMAKNVIEGAVLTFAATLPYIISFYISGNDASTIPLVLWVALGVAFFSNLLTWIFAVMLRNQATWSAVLQVAALIGVLVISVIHLAYPGIVDWWGTQLQALQTYAAQAQALAGALQDSASNANDTQIEAVNIVKQYAMGMLVVGVFLSAFSQLVMARWWQSMLYAPGLLRLELHNIRLTPLAGLLFIGSLVLNYLGNAVVLDIMPVLYLLFGAAGLSLIHYIFGVANIPSKLFWFCFFYVALLITMPFSLVLLAFIALFDIWLDVRKRVKKV